MREERTDQVPDFVLSDDAYRRMLDRRAHEYFGVSLDEFRQHLEGGRFDPESPAVSFLRSLLSGYRE